MKKMIEQKRTESENKAKIAAAVIAEMIADGEIITFSSVARRAGVSRNFLYDRPLLRETIESLRISLSKEELIREVMRLRMVIVQLKQALKTGEK